jgi:hypothetical protein
MFQLKQKKIFENAFKCTKIGAKSGHISLTIAVPDCERKTPIFSQKTRVHAKKEDRK